MIISTITLEGPLKYFEIFWLLCGGTTTTVVRRSMTKHLGIACDTHLREAFVSLGWVHPGEAEVIKAMEKNLSDQVELWLQQMYWGDVNNVLAGLRQLWVQSITNRSFIFACSLVKNCIHLRYA